MSAFTRSRSVNSSESDQRPVLVPAGNKSRTLLEARKPSTKPIHQRKVEKTLETTTITTTTITESKKKAPTMSPPMRNLSTPSILRHHHQHGSQLLRGNLSMNASCSSDASSDSSHSRASTGRISRSSLPSMRRKQQGASKLDKVVDSKVERLDGGVVSEQLDGPNSRKRCAWVTANTDPLYAKFHDEEWGVPVHEDNKLFELLSYAVALAELTWPAILNKRNIFREVFLDFDPNSVSKLNDKKIGAPGSPGSTILSELKLRNIVENARQICKITDEFGSFDKYIWGFMNHKPMVNKFRYPRQVPVKISKADVISKDLVRRGFRGVGPTVVYSFMQAAGLTNDHLVTCFRFQECVAAGEGIEKEGLKAKIEEKPGEIVEMDLATALDDLSICSE